MFSPPLYTIRKIPLKQIIDSDYKVIIDPYKEKIYRINQSDNMLFRQIRLITNENKKYNKYVVFVDCKGWKSKETELRRILKNGFYVNGVLFVPTEKSASMSRNSIMGFVDASLSDELNKRISMDMYVTSTVIAKWSAYRGLFFSGCFCLENWYPKIVIVDDYSAIIPNQNIKYLVDVETECIDKKTGKPYIWREKGIETGVKDVTINLWDGSGIHSPNVTKYVKEQIGMEETPTSILWRLPYGKGMTHEVDFVSWFKETGVKTITDVFSVTHDITEVDIVVTKSFYKGFKYFQKYKDKRDLEYYWAKFKEHNHCIGVAMWNYSFDNEPRMKQASYQILQDLELDFDEFLDLTDYSKEYLSKVIEGDSVYTNCFLGLFADKHNSKNDYVKAALKNQEMLKEESVRAYLLQLVKKTIDDMKWGKLYLNGTFKFVVTDLVMFLQYISGQEITGSLTSDGFYSVDYKGTILGERIIERNPHISKEEHLILNGVDHSVLNKYCGHLSNVCQVNGKSLCLPRLNGADEDGDRIFLIDSDTIKQGIIPDLPIVIDIEDKITAKEEEINEETIIDSTVRSMVSLVGEISNIATFYHNRTPKTDEQKQRYLEYINILSICNGKSIDYAKTGVLFHVPKRISRNAKPHPYFMKYASDYYMNKKEFSKSRSNMNQLAWHIEKWQKQFRFKRKFNDFNYKIMMDETLHSNEEVLAQMEELYLTFCRQMSELGKQNAMTKDHEQYDTYFGDLTSSDIRGTKVNWGYYYEKYLNAATEICPNPNERANYAVTICYEKHPKKNKKFIWIVASDGVLSNLRQEKIMLPVEDGNGKYEYMGRYYRLQEVD